MLLCPPGWGQVIPGLSVVPCGTSPPWLFLPSPCSRVLSTSVISQLRETEARNGAITEESSRSCAWVQEKTVLVS